ncbi:MAG: bifunctional 5,10-methylenetetrahydrofolate dehydrogenase/5,10-methenyltetrahydrofolate cyclohydrolase, partial [Armatimonadetes bacterium]|nr:bifunctional 5,10-methylenetetrahydrofolate dehydrogenase/5,10-methenyltetrahydrofolate cyclohydrolase [Armatimonadota bacterium]
MSARILEGQPIADRIKEDLRQRLAELGEPAPKLVAVMVGENPGAAAYAKQQARACEELGIGYELRQFAEDTSEQELLAAVAELNRDDSVTGIIIQMPLPEHIDRRRVQRAVLPVKDVDGVHPANLGATVQGRTELAPCTAQAVFTLVKESGVKIEGAELVMVGHSEIVGKPTALLLLDQFATTTVCHIATRDLAFHTRRADILIVAVGKAGLITGDMIKPGALVVDVGINRVKDPETGKSKIVGDVVFDEAKEVAGIITPVPGGVGPLT